MAARDARPRAGEGGFTLLEVLVAFVILALASGLLYRGAFGGAAASATAARYQEAVVRAQSRLASLGTLTALQSEDLSGDDGGGFHWHVTILREGAAGGLGLYAVRVVERFGDRMVVLETKRLGPVGQ